VPEEEEPERELRKIAIERLASCVRL